MAGGCEGLIDVYKNLINRNSGKLRMFASGRTKPTSWNGVYLIACLTLMTLTLAFVTSTCSFSYLVQSPDIEEKSMIVNDSIPKIIHQVWLGYDGKEPPQSWKNATEHSIRINPDFAYRLWSHDDVIELLTSHYAWFLPIYRSYPYHVERADAARYFIILRHGGIYLDMDEISVVPISDVIAANRLQRYQCVLPEGTPNGVTNYVIMCKRNSPFMARVTAGLAASKGWYGIPYATVMWSTGPRFISGVYDSYADKHSVYVMPRDQVTENFRCLFGQSWFSIDGVILHILVYPFIRKGLSWSYLAVIVIASVAFVGLLIWRRIRHATKLNNAELNVQQMP